MIKAHFIYRFNYYFLNFNNYLANFIANFDNILAILVFMKNAIIKIIKIVITFIVFNFMFIDKDLYYLLLLFH